MDLDFVRQFQIEPTRQHYIWKDTVLYALGLGYGSDPLDPAQLKFVYEQGLSVVPSMCNILAHPAFWLNKPELKFDWVQVLHAEQSFQMHQPLPVEGSVRGLYTIKSVTDKGPDKGAILTLEKKLVDAETDKHYYTVITSIFLRGDGGQGGFGDAPVPPTPLPEGKPDITVDIATMPQMALLYRLNGDTNPLHADPQIAMKGGFDRPILHGLGTMGIATRAILQGVCDHDPQRLLDMHVRFSSPVYPGETIRTEIYHANGIARFRCRSVERNVIVLDRGKAVVAK